MDTLIYTVCLAVGLLFTIISAAIGHFFGGTDGHADIGTGGHAEAGFDHTGMPGISFFSPTVLASFVTAFGAFRPHLHPHFRNQQRLGQRAIGGALRRVGGMARVPDVQCHVQPDAKLQ